MTLKLKNIDFTAIVFFFFFLKDTDIINILISNKISSSMKNYKYFIGYIDDNLKIKP